MRNVTPRIPQMEDAHQMIGRVLNNNCFSTLRGKLIYIQDEKCYFEIVVRNQNGVNVCLTENDLF